MIIDLQERELGEIEVLVLAKELTERAEQASYNHVAKLARRIAETAETLTMKDA